MPKVGPQAVSDAQSRNGSSIATLVSDPDLRRLFEYWRAQRRGRPMPARRDIDPLEIGWALSRIFLLDYDPDRGLVYRLAGDNIAGVFGHGNLKGLRLRDFLPPGQAETIEPMFMRVIEDRCVMGMKGMVYLRAGRLPLGERLFLPLADGETGVVNGVLGMTVVQSEPADSPAGAALASPKYIPVSEIP
jgi:hypothetical protein